MATLFNTKIKDTYQSLLKLEDNTILTTTTKNVTDGLGNASPLYMSTTRVGIGTNAPTSTLQIKSSGTTAATTSLLTQSSTGTTTFSVGDDGNILVGATTISFNNNPNFNRITSNFGGVTYDNDGLGSLRASYTNGRYSTNDRVGFGGVNNALSRVYIVGTGSTSATTSLLVQNSSSVAALTITDDANVTFGGSVINSSTSQLNFTNPVPIHRLGNFTFNANTIASFFGTLQIQGASSVAFGNAAISYLRDTLVSIQAFLPSNDTRNGLIFNDNYTNAGAGASSTGNLIIFNNALNTSIGNVTLNLLSVTNTINTTAGTTLQRGFYYNPTLTGTVGFTHRAIETVTGNVLLGTTSGNVGVGEASPTARLQVKGSGSTSATTSLLVQNSGGNSAVTISDDLTTTFRDRIKIDSDTISFLASPSNTYIQQSLGTGYGYYSAAISNQIMINAQPKIIVKDTGASRASTLIVGHSVATSAAADASALLEVRSDATYLKGFLPPRMTTAQKNAIVTPAEGLIVMDITLHKLCVYSGTAWETITSV